MIAGSPRGPWGGTLACYWQDSHTEICLATAKKLLTESAHSHDLKIWADFFFFFYINGYGLDCDGQLFIN